jgi:hypothetical protein
MGHSQIGTLPATKRWKEVVRLIADGANIEQVADATARAAERAFAWVQDDAGFREAANLMVQLALAARAPDPVRALAGLGLQLSEETSAAELAVAVGDVFDQRLEAARSRSDFGEMAGKALVGAILGEIREKLPTLFAPTREQVIAALKGLSGQKGFGAFARSFFGRLTTECLDYFLSKNLATHLGEGHRFVTNNQMAEFMSAMRTHCEEASGITEQFAAEWFSKHRFEEGGDISPKSTEGFAWYAMQKMRAELAARAKENER